MHQSPQRNTALVSLLPPLAPARDRIFCLCTAMVRMLCHTEVPRGDGVTGRVYSFSSVWPRSPLTKEFRGGGERGAPARIFDSFLAAPEGCMVAPEGCMVSPPACPAAASLFELCHRSPTGGLQCAGMHIGLPLPPCCACVGICQGNPLWTSFSTSSTLTEGKGSCTPPQLAGFDILCLCM